MVSLALTHLVATSANLGHDHQLVLTTADNN